ncbi:MAG TPA: SpoIIE family protein phosphatase [Terriglobia bacterium]|nr:SpoIIE family protein phosphatase [Terriglobia bacterium]
MGDSPSPNGAGRTAAPPDRQDPYLRLHAVTVFVRDQDKSLRFYRDQLGFNLIADVRFQSGDRWVAVAPPDGTAILTLVAPQPESPDYKLIGRATRVAFVTEDVLAKFHEWRARGVRFQNTPRLRRIKYERQPSHPPPAPGEPEPIWGGVFTRFKDLDGNSFSLVSFDEVIREVEAQRRAAAERLEAERRVAQELDIAKQVQAHLFPQTLPALRTLDYAGLCLQARAVGGDYYDFLNLGRERLGLVVGDISGKGIAAALLMANLQANLRSLCALAWAEPQRFLRSVNQLFYENTTESAYATLFFAEYHDPERRLRYASCGHLSALLLRRDRTLERLPSTATVLGLFAEWDCDVGELQLNPGDTLLLFTDGVTESFNSRGEEFGEQRLIDVLRCHRELPAHALLASIVDEVRRFSPREQHDDITMIAARCREDGP